MSTGAIIAIVVAAIVVIALIAIALPRMRANARERELARRRTAVANAHRDRASDRAARAEEAEQIAARERAEAELHETRARLHERGLADDELVEDHEREHFEPAMGNRAEDEGVTERDAGATERSGGTVHEPVTEYEQGRIDEREGEGGRFGRGGGTSAEQDPGARRA